MKIFFPVEIFFPSQAGGHANSIYWLSKNIAKHGFESTIVATDKGLDPEFPVNRWMENEAGRVIYIKRRFSAYPIYQSIISLLTFYKADIVHLSSIFLPAALLVGFASRILRKKVLWSARGELAPSAMRYSQARKRLALWFIKNFIGAYPTFHSTSDEETRLIKAFFGERATVIQLPNYLELHELAERCPGNYLLFLGRLHPIKAIDNLIRALPKSTEFMRSDHILKIAGYADYVATNSDGDGVDYESELRSLVAQLKLENKVEFLGRVTGDEKQKLFANAYFTIVPSHTESFGIVVLESLAQNTPVIASKQTPWKSLEDEGIGLWVENSPEELARSIDTILLMSEADYNAFRERSREFVAREFDIRKNIDKWIDVYRSLK